MNRSEKLEIIFEVKNTLFDIRTVEELYSPQ